MSEVQVLIKNATYGARDKYVISNATFLLRKGYNADKGYITVFAQPHELPKGAIAESRDVRLKLTGPEDFVVLGDAPAEMGGTHTPVVLSVEDEAAVLAHQQAMDEERQLKEYYANENDEAALKRINRSFKMLGRFSDLAVEGKIRGLIVIGPPGIGKSHETMEALKRSSLFGTLAGEDSDKHFVAKGTISAPVLYQKLYDYRNKDQTLILDDVDIAGDVETLNTLKAALDTSGKRTITWLKQSKANEALGIPDKFEYEGSIVCLTNEEFAGKSGAKGNHLGAVLDRCHTVRLEIHNMRDRMLRIKDVVMTSPMLNKFNMNGCDKVDLLNFMDEYRDHLTEVTLRTAINIATLFEADPEDWKELSVASCMNPSAMQLQLLKEIQIADQDHGT